MIHIPQYTRPPSASDNQYLLLNGLLYLSTRQVACAASATDSIAISPDQLTNATIEIRGSDIYYELRTPAGIRSATIATQTEKAIHLAAGDYDFSGRQGFAFWSIDEGQGVYKIYRVFTF